MFDFVEQTVIHQNENRVFERYAPLGYELFILLWTPIKGFHQRRSYQAADPGTRAQGRPAHDWQQAGHVPAGTSGTEFAAQRGRFRAVRRLILRHFGAFSCFAGGRTKQQCRLVIKVLRLAEVFIPM